MTAMHPVEPEPPKMGGTSILQKLLAVMKDCGYIQKDKKNTFHGYSYASEAAIKDRVHAALVEHGVIPQVSLLGLTEREITRVNAKGQQVSEWLTTANVYYKFWCVETGEYIDGTFYGCGVDPSDKGLYKAITGAIKYLLTSQFLIPTGDDPENDEGRTATPAEKKGKQDDYVRSKGLEPYVAPKHQNNQPPPDIRTASEQHKALILETAKMLNEQPSIHTMEMRSAAQVAEADAALKEAKKPPAKKKGAVSFDVLKHFGLLKKEIEEVWGHSQVYYDVLEEFGYKHANEIQDNDKAREIYRAMGPVLSRGRRDKDLRNTLLEIETVLGKKEFADILRLDYGIASIDEVLTLESERLQALLTYLHHEVQQKASKS